MTDSKKLRHIGKIKSAHGLKGEVFLLVFSKDISWLNKVKVIYLSSGPDSLGKEANEKNNVSTNEKIEIKKPYGIQSFKPHKDGALIYLNEIENRNQSESLVGLQVWVEDSAFISKKNESLYLVEIENFLVQDNQLGQIGQIKGFSTNHGQDLLLVASESDKNFVEIPFVDAYVIKIDMENKILFTQLPEGLLDINKEDAE